MEEQVASVEVLEEDNFKIKSKEPLNSDRWLFTFWEKYAIILKRKKRRIKNVRNFRGSINRQYKISTIFIYYVSYYGIHRT